MTFEVIVSLLYGGLFVVVTVCWLLQFRSVHVFSLVFGAAFTTLGVLGLGGFMTPEWFDVSRKAATGIMGVYGSCYWRGTPAHTNWPKWTGAALVFGCGVGLILWAVGSAWYLIQ